MNAAETQKKESGLPPFQESDVFLFPSGLPGFGNLHRFILAADPGYAPFEWLWSVEDPSIRFVTVNPLLFRPDYDPKLTREHLHQLGIQQKEHLRMLVIVTLQADYHLSTANLAGPVWLSLANRIGMQTLLEDTRYSVREPILGRSS
jgi:flagellar assembly factor FliW